MCRSSPPPSLWGNLVLVAGFAVAMGLLEAICVIYLRHLLPSAGTTHTPGTPTPRFPIELWREVCTIVMLLAVGGLAGRNLVTRFGYFLAAFGVWDIWYYAGLRIWSGWPPSLMTWDCLFLLPCPWYGPVLAPVLISLTFIASCLVIIRGEETGRPLRATVARAGLLTLGWLIWILSFTLPAYGAHAASHPASYPWWAFTVGVIPAVAAAWPPRRNPREVQRKPP